MLSSPTVTEPCKFFPHLELLINNKIGKSGKLESMCIRLIICRSEVLRFVYESVEKTQNF